MPESIFTTKNEKTGNISGSTKDFFSNFEDFSNFISRNPPLTLSFTVIILDFHTYYENPKRYCQHWRVLLEKPSKIVKKISRM